MKNILKLIDLIYESVTNASRWQIFLDAFVRALQGRGGGLLVNGVRMDGGALVCWSGWSVEDVNVYVESYAAIDPWRIRADQLLEGTVEADFELCPRTEMESSAAFQEYYAPRGYVHGMGGIILVAATGRSLISVVRGESGGPFGESEKAILSTLLPHLRRAALLHGEVGSMRTQLNIFTSHLDRYPHALVLTDTEHRVLYANWAARELVGQMDGVVIDAGRSSLQSPPQDLAFQEAMRRITSGSDGSIQRVEVSRPSRKRPYRLVLMPAEASGSIPLGVSPPAVSLLIVDSESQQHPDPAVLRELFSLTPAEAGVVVKLVLGRNVEEIAVESGISRETVRTHLKRILSKTGTKRQSELVSLILRSTPFRYH